MGARIEMLKSSRQEGGQPFSLNKDPPDPAGQGTGLSGKTERSKHEKRSTVGIKRNPREKLFQPFLFVQLENTIENLKTLGDSDCDTRIFLPKLLSPVHFY